MSLLNKAVFAALLVVSACDTTKNASQTSEAPLAEGTNSAFSHTVTTQASADAVWALWTDVSTWKDWDKGLKDAHMEGFMALGAKGKIVPLSGSAADFEVTEFVEGESYSFETRLPGARLKVRRSFVSRDPIVFRHDVSFSGPMAGVLAGQLGPAFRAQLPPTMETLAALANATSTQP